MNQGKIQQLATPHEIYNHPANTFVASFVGEINLYPSTSRLAQHLGVKPSGHLGFRPEHVKVASYGTGFPAKVLISTYLGSKNQMIVVTPEGEELKAWTSDFVEEGTQLHLTIEPRHLLHFDQNGQAMA
jgi:ABC-type sugar transport system ATPase subunit